MLYRYTNGNWEALATSMTSSDADNVNYQSETPGFSYFAVGNKEAAPAVAPPTSEAQTQPTPAPVTPAPSPAVTSPSQPTIPAAKTSSNTIAWIVVAIIIIVAAIGFLMMRKKE